MTDKQIIIDANYYKELFKAFYNKRFKNVKEVRQLAETKRHEIWNAQCLEIETDLISEVLDV